MLQPIHYTAVKKYSQKTGEKLRAGNSLIGFRSESLFLLANERFAQKNERFAHSLIFGERPERFAHIAHQK